MANGGEFALEHRTRRMIYNYILEHPGVSFGRIKKVLDLTASTLRYHLKTLKKADRVTSKIEDGKRCYYSSEAKTGSSGDQSGRNPTQRHLLAVIKDNPGITTKELVRKTRIKKQTVAYNIRKLVEHKLIWKVRKGRETGYEYITKKGLNDEMVNLLLNRFLEGEIDEKTLLELLRRLEKR